MTYGEYMDGLSEKNIKILKLFGIPDFLIEIIDEWVNDAWSEGCWQSGD